MRKYLKATYRKALKLFFTEDELYTAAEKELDETEAHNTAILTEIINGIKHNKYLYAYIRQNNNIFTFTNSIYHPNAVQLTFIRDEKPTGHRDIKTAEDIRHDIPDGTYINIVRA